MKKLLTILLALLLFNNLKAANYYTFSTTTSTYTELTNPTVVTTTFDKEGYDIAVGTFKLFGLNWDTIGIKTFGAIISQNHQADRMFAVDGFAVKKFLSRDATSSISYTFEGTAGSRILKVQYKNVTPKDGDATKDYVNFQIWLWENGDKIEMHYGTSNISDVSKVFTFDTDKGPLAGIFLSDLKFVNKYEIQFLRMDPASPGISTNITTALGGIPANGRVYVYEHKVVVEQPKLDLVSPLAQEVWNVGQKREIKWTSKLVRKIKIEYSYNGFTNFQTIVDSVDAAPGMYLWTVPNTVSDQCFVRISDVDNPARKSETAIPFAIKPAGTGIGEISNNAGFKVYPNPGNGIYTIAFTDAKVSSASIIITAMDGKTVFAKPAGNIENTIDISHVQPGVYVMKMQTGNSVSTTLLIKK